MKGAQKYLDDELLEFLARAIAEHGSRIVKRKFENLKERPSIDTYERRFKSWNNAKREAIKWAKENGIKIVLDTGLNYKGGQKKTKPENDEPIESIEYKQSNDELFVTTESLEIKTLDDLIKKAEVDLNIWRVEKHLINNWTIIAKVKVGDVETPQSYTNYQVKAWFKPRIIQPLETSIRELIKEIPKFKYPNRKPKRLKASDFALEMAPYDAHFGKLAWGKETGQGDYDAKIAGTWFLDSIAQNLDYSTAFPISKIYYILGQDLIHAENFMGQTPLGGNKLDVDSRLIKLYTTAKECTLKAIYMCRDVAPVEVLWIPGNHDMHASFYLSDVVKEHFRNDKYVTVDNTPPWRKARLWGTLLVGYTHDTSGRRGIVNVNILAQFWPELWGKSKFREVHSGHKHKKEETKFYPTLTVGGVLIRQIPAISTIDAWHYQEGFVDAVPAGESFVWSKDCGVCAHYTAFVGEK